jgi:hypothetical protein
MTSQLPAGMRFRVLTLMALLGLLPAAPARADDWTTYADPNNLQDIAAEGNDLWIASSGGALRYNVPSGNFTQFPRRSAGGPVSQDLTSVCVFEPERLVYFGSEDNGVSEFDLDDVRWRRFRDIPDSRVPVNRIACLGTKVYIATDQGYIARHSAANSTICNEIDRACCGVSATCLFPSFDVRDFALQGDRLWAATANGPAEHDSLGTPRPQFSWRSRKTRPEVTDARSIVVHEGEVFLATGSPAGLFKWNGTGETWDDASLGLTPNRGLGQFARLQSIAGTLWLSTDYGAFTWNGSGWSAAGLANISVRGVAAINVPDDNPDAVIYAATSIGLHVRNGDGSWTLIPAPGPTLDVAGQAIDVDRNGVVHLGTLIGVMSVTPDGIWTTRRNGQDGIDPSDIFSVHADSQNRLWLGKCCCRNPPACPTQFIDDGVVSTPVEAWDGWGIAEDGAGRMWIGSNSTGVTVLGANGSSIATLTPTSTGGALRSLSIRTLLAEGDRVWLGHEDRGLQLLRTGGDPANMAGYTWKTFTTSDVPDATVADIAREGASIWVLTSAYLMRFQGESRTDLIALNVGNESRRGYAVDVDAKGNKWVGTSNGVLRIDRSGNVVVFNTSNSDLIANEVLDVAIDPTTDDVLFQTRIGASRLRPGSDPDPSDTADYFLFPNPFRSGSGLVKIGGGSADNAEVVDLLGRPVASFDPAFGWDGTGRNGQPVAPGVYVITVGGQNLRLAVLD